MGSRRHRFIEKGTMKLHLITVLAVWSCAEWGRVDGSNYPPNMPNIPSFDPRGAQHNNGQEEAAYVETAEEECCPCNEREQQSHGGVYGHNSKHGYGYGYPSYGSYGYGGGYKSYGKGYGGGYGGYGNHKFGGYGGYGGLKFGGYGGYGSHKYGGYGGFGGHRFGGYGGYGSHKFGGYGGYGGGYGNSDSDHTADKDE